MNFDWIARRNLELARRRGLDVRRQGSAWLIRGPGVHLLVADPSLLRPDDLLPQRHAIDENPLNEPS